MSIRADQIYYLSHLPKDESCGMFCTTSGSQACGPESKYPLGNHPLNYHFSKSGRILNEYQLIYITDGLGYFRSDTCQPIRVSAGNIILIYPGEKHSYYPDEKTGWSEMWVGFKGDDHLDKMISNMFNRKECVINIGMSDTVCDLYERILALSKFEKFGTQQAICGFINALLGYISYKAANFFISNTKNIDKIQRAQALLRESISRHISPAEIASGLGMSYSLLREQFKAVTGMSMSDYAVQQRINLAKNLLSGTDKSIKEIAFETGYESMSRFCCAFHQHVGITASEFRKRNRHNR
ncbi:MAG: AraC family transcriptional regulator [Bacteroidales bacterium]|nr:AraC family transcriptional regulator [Bacteroidales bacterium]